MIEGLGWVYIVALVAITLGSGSWYLYDKYRNREPHVHYSPHMYGPGARMLEGFSCRGCSAVWLDREDYKGWSDQRPEPDPMAELRKLQDEVDTLIEEPLVAEFKKLEREVADRELREARANIAYATLPPLSRMPKKHLPTYHHTQEENLSDVSNEERERESLLNGDIPL